MASMHNKVVVIVAGIWQLLLCWELYNSAGEEEEEDDKARFVVLVRS